MVRCNSNRNNSSYDNNGKNAQNHSTINQNKKSSSNNDDYKKGYNEEVMTAFHRSDLELYQKATHGLQEFEDGLRDLGARAECILCPSIETGKHHLLQGSSRHRHLPRTTRFAFLLKVRALAGLSGAQSRWWHKAQYILSGLYVLSRLREKKVLRQTRRTSSESGSPGSDGL